VTPALSLDSIATRFGDRLHMDVPLARYTTAQIGGPADGLLVVHSANDLAEATAFLWEKDIPFFVLGAGSNILVSGAGVRGVVVVNRAKKAFFNEEGNPPGVLAESGANISLIARKAAQRGLAGLEWAVGIPGTLGGAVVGNAGAQDGDIAGNFVVAEILHLPLKMQENGSGEADLPTREKYSKEKMAFTYRSSTLKRSRSDIPEVVILTTTLCLERSTPQIVNTKMKDFSSKRHSTQPPGASMGSIFKNPPGDYAGRLIEAAGLKGLVVGDAEVSALHANFIINRGKATALDIYRLIHEIKKAVLRKSGIGLELEIELVGEW